MCGNEGGSVFCRSLRVVTEGHQSMNWDQIYEWALWLVLGTSAVTFPALFFITLGYGRHDQGKSMLYVPSLPGWILMEAPSWIVFPLTFFLLGRHNREAVPLCFLAIWQLHYFYRGIIFPLRMRNRNKRKPVGAVIAGFLFTGVNGFVQAYAITNLSPHLWTPDWFADPRFIVGILLMLIGVSINIHSDSVLRNLRAPGETGYKIPHGGLYRWISAPNYFGEMIEWLGLAIAVWNVAGLSFFLFTVANLFPRALAHHRWYKERFPDYPPGRKAIIPGLI
ncbi:MAG: DUF1295 domain-containing protein [Candidatus Dadabacteria bacterium]|nr:MAG: DUF1295 domain-containing protein [Candidatus Dadabacteria bacterium]